MNQPNDRSSPKLVSVTRPILFTLVVGCGLVALIAGASEYREMAIASEPFSANRTQRQAQPAGFADLVARAKPAVISVRVKMNDAANEMSSYESGNTASAKPALPYEKHSRVGHPIIAEGSGFFVSADGYAVTNHHVVDHATSVQVTTDDGTTYPAKVIGADEETDLALIKVEGTQFPFVKFADHQSRNGDWVLAIGNPFGLGGTVTAGIVSSTDRDINGPYTDYIQIDAPINRGNSGGPAFDLNGNVIGVNTAIYSPSGGSVGIGFDIPAATAKSVIAELKSKGHVTRGWLGVELQPVTPEIADGLGMKNAEGVIVDEAQPDSPAARAGVKPGDVITGVNGAAVSDPRELMRKIAAMNPGTTIALAVLRNGETKRISVVLAAKPGAQAATGEHATPEGPQDSGPHLGVVLAPASDVTGAGNKGVVVVDVEPEGVAAEHGIGIGDVILDVAGQAVSDENDVRNKVAELWKEKKRTVLMRIKSGVGTIFIALPLHSG